MRKEDMLNAFATGRNPRHMAVAVTTGTLRLLSEHELRGVMAHELPHVQYRDIPIDTISATMACAISMLPTRPCSATGRMEKDGQPTRPSDCSRPFWR